MVQNINEDRPAFDDTSKAKCIFKLMNIWRWTETWTNACCSVVLCGATQIKFAICFSSIWKWFFFYVFSSRFFYRPLYFIASFSMPNCISKLLHQIFFKYRSNGAIRDGASSIDGQHIQPTIFVVSSVSFNSAGTLTLELFPLTCLMHLKSFFFTQTEWSFFTNFYDRNVSSKYFFCVAYKNIFFKFVFLR